MTEIKTATVYIGANDRKYKTETAARESIQWEKFVTLMEKAIALDRFQGHDFSRMEYYDSMQFTWKYRKEIIRILREVGDT